MSDLGNGLSVGYDAVNQAEPSEFEQATMAHYVVVEEQNERIARALEAVAIFLAEVKVPRRFLK